MVVMVVGMMGVNYMSMAEGNDGQVMRSGNRGQWGRIAAAHRTNLLNQCGFGKAIPVRPSCQPCVLVQVM